MRKLGWLALCAAGAMAVAGQANAALVNVTYTGVATGIDDNIFGSSQSYINTPFVAHYSFDEVAAYLGEPGGNIGSFLGADFTINGVTIAAFAPGFTAFGAGADGDIPGYARTDSVTLYEHEIGGENDYRFVAISNSVTSSLVPEERTDPFSASVVNASGLSSVWNFLYVESRFTGASFQFTNQSVTVTSVAGTPTTGHGVGAVAGIPEPSTWAMMLVGFFGLGIALRRQRMARAEA